MTKTFKNQKVKKYFDLNSAYQQIHLVVLASQLVAVEVGVEEGPG
jgi:hypothetical protein